jgi:hypothetical protein
MDFQAIRSAIDIGTESGRIMAQVVVSSYRRGEMMNLYDLDHLDAKNFDLVIQVISYRRTGGWCDEDYWKLERYAARRLASTG